MLQISQPRNCENLTPEHAPVDVAAGLLHLPGLMFLDTSSAEDPETPGARGVSIIAARPIQIFTGNIFEEQDVAKLQSCLKQNQLSGLDLGFPVGGLIGGVEYKGDFHFGQYPEMLIHDHNTQQWLEIGNLSKSIRWENSDPPSLQPFHFRNSITEKEFCDNIARAKEYIVSGDIYQVNLTHRFEADWHGDSREAFALYQKLRETSPAPFSGFFRMGSKTILSSSPEQFLRISGKTIETRPIKGTRPRFRNREKDEKSAYDLITSPKEISELIMITDLERNDLGQICEFGSVEAAELLKLERYAQVFHLVSTVRGTLREDIDHISALQACFPGGSITGAPKKRAREIIDELENVPRGLYTGTLGCLGFNGESIFNIVIRTAVCDSGKIFFHTGAGIVADSSPEAEWEETHHKAAGIIKAAAGGNCE